MKTIEDYRIWLFRALNLLGNMEGQDDRIFKNQRFYGDMAYIFSERSREYSGALIAEHGCSSGMWTFGQDGRGEHSHI